MKIQPQYNYDNNGMPVGVFLTLKDWHSITETFTGIEELPQWQKTMIDQRLDVLKNHPDQLIPLDDFLTELGQEARAWYKNIQVAGLSNRFALSVKMR